MLMWRILRHVIAIGMRRTLYVNVSRCIGYFLFNPVSAARTAERVQGFPVNLLRTLATKPPNMDLSNMRKKYKGDEEVSGCQTYDLPVARFIISPQTILHMLCPLTCEVKPAHC